VLERYIAVAVTLFIVPTVSVGAPAADMSANTKSGELLVETLETVGALLEPEVLLLLNCSPE
jgi:hypothetical protein